MAAIVNHYFHIALQKLLSPLRPDTSDTTFRHLKYMDHQFLVLLNQAVGWRMWLPGERFEEEEIRILRERIDPDFICIDVGANLGVYSVLLSSMVPQGGVYAFEPHALAHHMLNINLILNSVENVEVFNILVSDEEKEVGFSEATDSAFSSMIDTGRRKVARTTERKAIDLDKFAAERSLVLDFVKIDVEGAELQVLQGMKKQLSDTSLRPKYLLVEADRKNLEVYGQRPEDVVAFLKKYGYRARTISWKGLEDEFNPDIEMQNVLFSAQ